jgi:hypothetical protein
LSLKKIYEKQHGKNCIKEASLVEIFNSLGKEFKYEMGSVRSKPGGCKSCSVRKTVVV